MKSRPLRIIIADARALLRVGIRTILEAQSRLSVVGECRDGESAVRMAHELNPDVVIMDLMMPKMNGAEATEKILANAPAIHVIVLSSFGASSEMARAIHAGAAGALLKESPSDELIKTILTVMDGGTAISREISDYMDTMESQPEFTQRQLDILAAIAAGGTDKAIAAQLGISVAGVRKHLIAVMSKLGATSRTEAVAIALRRCLLDT